MCLCSMAREWVMPTMSFFQVTQIWIQLAVTYSSAKEQLLVDSKGATFVDDRRWIYRSGHIFFPLSPCWAEISKRSVPLVTIDIHHISQPFSNKNTPAINGHSGTRHYRTSWQWDVQWRVRPFDHCGFHPETWRLPKCPTPKSLKVEKWQ